MQLLRQNWCLAICKIISSNFKLCDKSPIWNIRETLTQTLFNILTFYIKLYLISAHIYTEYGHSQGMSLIYRCCTFSKYQHSPLAGIPLDLLCSSRKSSPEHKMMFLSTDIVRQTIHNEHWKIMTMGKVKLAHLKKSSKKPKKTHKKTPDL